jgi:hypothetical protein
MGIMSLLSEAGVPRDLLRAARQNGTLPSPAGQPGASAEDIDAALGRLASRSLLTFSIDDSVVTVHRITMRVIREREAGSGRLPCTAVAVAGMIDAATGSLAKPWQNWLAAHDIIQQINALHEHVTGHVEGAGHELTDSILRLRGWALSCLTLLGGGKSQAIEIGPAVVADSEQMRGQADAVTLISQVELARRWRCRCRDDRPCGGSPAPRLAAGLPSAAPGT